MIIYALYRSTSVVGLTPTPTFITAKMLRSRHNKECKHDSITQAQENNVKGKAAFLTLLAHKLQLNTRERQQKLRSEQYTNEPSRVARRAAGRCRRRTDECWWRAAADRAGGDVELNEIAQTSVLARLERLEYATAYLRRRNVLKLHRAGW